jgi:hypothetical protein
MNRSVHPQGMAQINYEALSTSTLLRLTEPRSGE